MKEITFVHPISKLTRTIKVCETQNELIGVIRERRKLNNGSVFVIYKNGGYFHQLLGSSGYKTSQFKRYGIKSATVSSFSGELFVFGDFAITPDGLVCIGEENIKKYGSYGVENMVYEKVLCPYCKSDKVIRYGKNRTGKQRIMCQNPECSHKTFQLEYSNNVSKPETKEKIIDMAMNGSGTRYTCRVLKSHLIALYLLGR